MSRGECTPEQMAECPLMRHFQDQHHIWWPKRDYRSQLEKRFRNLPENKEVLCRYEHDLTHYEAPPIKPSREVMAQAIASAAISLTQKAS